MKDNEKLGLTEIRLQFDREENRKQALESKASYILGFISLMITVILTIIVDIVLKSYSLINAPFNYIIIILTLLFLIFLGISAGFCINILTIKKIYYPYDSLKPNKFKDRFSKDEENLDINLYDSYLTATYSNNIRNNKKADFITYSIYFLTGGIVVLIILIISLLVSIW